jgi:Flp pilus assembly pilin Flp
MQQKTSFGRLLRRVHEDQRGAVSIETIMIIGAIAIPILIFLLKFGWPRIKDYFNNGMNDLEANRTRVMNNG